MNCETDFVARGEVFQGLASDIAMQLASNAQVESISKDEFPQDLLEKERQVALQMEDIQSKPENIRYKAVMRFTTFYRAYLESCEDRSAKQASLDVNFRETRGLIFSCSRQ